MNLETIKYIHEFLADYFEFEEDPISPVGIKDKNLLESAHAVAYALKLAKTMTPDQTIIVNMSGRGDKDLHSVMKAEGIEL